MTNALRALVAVLILAIAGGFWYFAFGPYGQQQAANQQLRQDVTLAQQAIASAPGEDPAKALTALGQSRDRLVNDLANPSLDAGYRSVGEDVLANQLQPAVQQTIQRYNSAALVTPVNTSSAQFYRLSCQTSGGGSEALTTISHLTTLNVAQPAAASAQTLYAINAGHLYQITVPLSGGLPQSGASCLQVPLSGIATVVALAADGTSLNVLAEQPSGQYLVAMVSVSGVNSDGTAKTIMANRFNVATAGGETPSLIAASGADVFIAYTRTSAGTFGVWHYSSPLPAPTVPRAKPTPAPRPPTGPTQTVLLQRQAVSLAYSHNVLYMLDSAGGLSQVNAASQYKFSALPVQIPSPLKPAAPEDYSVTTPVPTPQPTPVGGAAQTTGGAMPVSLQRVAVVAATTATATTAATVTPIPVTPTASSGTLFGKNGTLAIDPAFPTHLLICDATQDRLVRLVASASGPGLGFAAQYAYDAPLLGATQVAVSSTGKQLVVYTWANNGLAAYIVPETGAGA
jgi:hypothetical protein